MKLPRLFVVTLALGVLAPSASAQIPADLLGRRIDDVLITGETSGATGAREVGISPGAELSRQLLRSATEQLLGSGRWADVQIDAMPSGGGARLFVHLVPRVLITRVDVSGIREMRRDELVQALGLGPGGQLESQDLAPLARAAAEAYAQRGYVDARITLRLRDTDDPTRKVLMVDVDEGEPLRVLGFVYQGDEPPPDFDFGGELGLGRGSVLDRSLLRDGVNKVEQKLREEGWLEARVGRIETRREENGAELIVPLRLGPHYEVRLLGHEPLTRQVIEAALRLSDDRLTRTTLESLRERVADVLRRHGFHDAEVELDRYAGEREGTAVLEIRMEPGRQLHVVGMAFPGARHFESGYLRGQVVSVLEEELPDTRLFAPVDSETLDRLGLGGRATEGRERRIPPPLEVDPGRVYHEALYERVIEHLSELYQAQGFLSARVGPVRLETLDGGRAVVSIPVFEGPRSLLYGVSLRGNEVIGDRELLHETQLVRGEPFSYLALEEAVARMTALYHERGYLYARIEPAVRFSEDRERAEIAIRVIERFEVRFGEIRVEGATRTSVSLIRDLLRFEPGDLYRTSVVAASQEALMGLGVFNSVSIAPIDPDLPERIKAVTVTVRERFPQYVDLTAGISTGQGVRATGEYGYRNIGGYALGLTLRAQVGFQFFFQDEELRQNITPLGPGDRLERRINLTLTLPKIPGIDNLRTTLDLVHLRDNERVFGLDKIFDIILSINWRPLRNVSFTLSGELEHNGVQLFGDRTSIEQILNPPDGQPPPDPRVVRLLRVPLGDSVVASARLSGSIDQRDNPFVPTRGWYTSGTAEWVRTLEIIESGVEDPIFSHFLKLGLTLNGYVPIGDVVLAGQARAGGIIHLEPGSRTYPNRQYFLGGVDSLRGFNQDQLQPQDVADLQLTDPSLPTGTVIQGGDFFYLLRAEVRFPIPLFEGLQAAVFADLGNHWADPASIVLDEHFVRPTAGLGVRIATPVGPLALDYGFNLLRRRELGEPFGALHFSIGVF